MYLEYYNAGKVSALSLTLLPKALSSMMFGRRPGGIYVCKKSSRIKAM